MIRKSCFLLLFLAFLSVFSSCEDVIDVDLPQTDNRIVIDAYIRVPGDQQSFTSIIRITKTAAYDTQEITPVIDAQVNLNFDGRTFAFKNQENGYYSRDFVTENLRDKEIQLQVNYNEETYQATTQLVEATPIAGLEQGSNTLFSGDETELVISFTDVPDIKNYYLFDLDYGFYFLSEDTFYQDNAFSFSYFYEDLEPTDEVQINLMGINKAFNDYMTVILAQASQSSGGPFEAPPALAKGNIINITNPENYPLGYFAISEQFSKKLIIE